MFFSSFLKDLGLAFPAIPVVLHGWQRFFSELYGRFKEFFFEKSGSEKFIFVFSFAQLLFSLSSWVGYRINLGSEERENIRVATNIFFILPSFLVFFFGGFWRSDWLYKVLFILQIFLGLLLGLGFFMPDIFFVSFISESDYEFNWKFYTFAGIWLLTTLLVSASNSSKEALRR
ncbi:hypothetical protein EHO61_14545 [Leptospira fluminis]|uniref:Uncharacterized protein n=1 Tax=Leptospira fluminis TaxID=2484979 RepID=A0A4R9GLF3_9LEPT|nr:hypothetical protein [Leptospira fluminis]TGK15576.1 hypothetical protein EHO61_14545 [Leptospira fluminis]